MAKAVSGKTIAKNLIFSVAAQLASILVNLLLNLVVPRYLAKIEFANWHVYHMYIAYTSIFHFGLLDGLILRYSHCDYEELDKNRIRSQFYTMLVTTNLMGIGCALYAFFMMGGVNQFVLYMFAVGLVVKNAFTYTSFAFQMTNRINDYARITILSSVVYGLSVAGLLIFGVRNYEWYCVADLAANALAVVVAILFVKKDLFVGKGMAFKPTLREWFTNVGAGVVMLIAGFASDLLVGGAKMVIQWCWSKEVFADVSFSFSVTSLFLRFVTAVSVVLFPSIKRMKTEELPLLYSRIRNAVSPLLFVLMLAYFPVCELLKLWLPAYESSLVYLGVLLPLIIFASKVSLLTNNYLRAYRKEKTLLVINLASVAVGFGLALACGYWFKNLDALLYCAVFAIMLRSVLSELAVGKIIGRKKYWEFFVELFMTAVFIFAARYLELWVGCAVYAVAVVLYLAVNFKNLKELLSLIGGALRKRKASKQKPPPS